MSYIGVSEEKFSFPHLWAVWAALRHPYRKLAKHSYLPILWYYGTVSHIGVSVEKISFPHLWAVWAALRHPLQEASQALLLTNQPVVLWYSVPH